MDWLYKLVVIDKETRISAQCVQKLLLPFDPINNIYKCLEIKSLDCCLKILLIQPFQYMYSKTSKDRTLPLFHFKEASLNLFAYSSPCVLWSPLSLTMTLFRKYFHFVSCTVLCAYIVVHVVQCTYMYIIFYSSTGI